MEALARVIIGNRAYVAVDAKDFLDQNNRAVRRAAAFRKVCVEFVTIGRLQSYLCAHLEHL